MTVSTRQEATIRDPRSLREPEREPSAIPEPTRVGEVLGGRYRITRLLAAGGMGVVYEAHHEIVKRRFAVKFLRPDYAHRRQFLARFQRKAEATGALESDHIASTVDFGVAADGSPFIVMECLVGEDLASLQKREGRLPLERAADLCIQTCHGAEVAHAAGILHRDLKPQNLFICRREDGTDLLKILDFGIAKLAAIRHDHATTETGKVMGTPAYMSPEHARGERALDPRSDVYALGAILFEMLSGELPHPGDSPNAILHHISTRAPVPLEVVASGLPSALVETVNRALSTSPDARPPSAKALAQELVPFAKRQVWPDQGGEKPNSQQAGEEIASSANTLLAKGAAANVEHRSGSKARVLLVAVAVVVAAAIATVIVSHTRSTPTSMVVPQPAAKQAPPAEAGSRLRPAVADAPVPPTPAIGSPPVPSGADVRAPVKPATAKRPRVTGRPSGRSHERPAEIASPSNPLEQAPAPRPAQHRMPTADLDPDNPYSRP